MLRNIVSVVVPVLFWGLLWVLGGQVFMALFPHAYDARGLAESSSVLGILILFSALLSIGAGWLCAKISKRGNLRLVLILGVVQLLIGIGVQLSVWNSMPLWYHIIFLGLVIPMHVLGGKLGTHHVQKAQLQPTDGYQV